MKILKRIVIIIGAVFALLLIAGLFVNSEFSVQREVHINRSRAEVFDYLRLLKNQDKFSVWLMRDPDMKKEYRGTDGTVGFVSAWDSEKKEVGKGEQEIKGIEENERIDFELRFKEPFESTDHAYIVTESIDPGHTKVKWGFDGKMSYPMNIVLLFVDMEAELGSQLNTSLMNLKAILENQDY